MEEKTNHPYHPLNQFSEEWVLFRICCYAVDLLEKMRKYDEAVTLIETLLTFDWLCLQVADHHEDLLSQATGIETLEGIFFTP